MGEENKIENQVEDVGQNIEENVEPTQITPKRDVKKILTVAGVFIFGIALGVGVFAGLYNFKFKKKFENQPEQSVEEMQTMNEAEQAVEFSKKLEGEVGDFQLISDDNTIWKDDIKWQEPKRVGNLGLTTMEVYRGQTDDSRGVKYFKVGEIKEGKYAGGELILISAWVADGPMNSPSYFHMIRKDNKAFFLSKDLDEYQVEMIKKFFPEGSLEKTLASGVVVEGLVFPEQLRDDSNGSRFEKNKYDHAFFTDAKLKKAFIHPQYGQVWVTDESKNSSEPTEFEPNSYVNWEQKITYHDIFGSGAFFLKSPDGLAVSYSLISDIADEEGSSDQDVVLDVYWNDGSRNYEKYEKSPGGCGLSKYVYDKTSVVDLDTDLVIVGKTSRAKNVYGLGNINHPEFTKLYDDIYWVEEGEQKLSKEEFIKTNPEVFWVDPFGRTLAFFKASIISPAECGKPVIYLYPEKTTEIEVQVNPTGGMSVSDPDYGKGWKVISDNQSNITNISDGLRYPYLFWEGSSKMFYQMPDRGFVVARDDLRKFFDDKLSKLGLIEKEIDDFKEFWVPKISAENKPYYFVTFLPQSLIDKMAPLSVSPQPETIIRVLMDYEGLDEFKQVPEFEIKAPQRKGFTVVEWGGMLK